MVSFALLINGDFVGVKPAHPVMLKIFFTSGLYLKLITFLRNKFFDRLLVEGLFYRVSESKHISLHGLLKKFD